LAPGDDQRTDEEAVEDEQGSADEKQTLEEAHGVTASTVSAVLAGR
jgi:hypothetical protein